MNNSNTWKSQDFYLACVVLASKKLKLISLERSEGKIVTFVFEDPNSEAEEIIKAHWERKMRIPTRNLIDAIVELKTRIHSGI